MRKKIVINFTVGESGIQADTSLSEVFKTLAFGIYRLTIILVQDVRSPQQNSWYWWVLTQLTLSVKGTAYDGMTKDEWHEAFGQSFLSEEKFIGTLSYIRVRSTADLDKDEFTEYIEKVLTFAEKELSIPRKHLLPKFTDMECPF